MKTITYNALRQRINRKHAREGNGYKFHRQRKWSLDTGWFHVVDGDRNFQIRTHIDPVADGRELGVLKPHESCEVTQ